MWVRVWPRGNYTPRKNLWRESVRFVVVREGGIGMGVESGNLGKRS